MEKKQACDRKTEKYQVLGSPKKMAGILILIHSSLASNSTVSLIRSCMQNKRRCLPSLKRRPPPYPLYITQHRHVRNLSIQSAIDDYSPTTNSPITSPPLHKAPSPQVPPQSSSSQPFPPPEPSQDLPPPRPWASNNTAARDSTQGL